MWTNVVCLYVFVHFLSKWKQNPLKRKVVVVVVVYFIWVLVHANVISAHVLSANSVEQKLFGKSLIDKHKSKPSFLPTLQQS